MLKKIFCLAFISSFTYADVITKEISLPWLESLPRSTAKDFYIWQYLDQDISPDEALIALSGSNRVNNNLFFRFAKKFEHDETYAVAQCMQASAKDLVNQDVDCIENGLSISKALSLDVDKLSIVSQKLKESYPTKATALEIINSPMPFARLSSASSDVFFEIFNKVSSDFRYLKLNYRLTSAILDKIKDKPQFNQTIKLIVTDTRLKNLQSSLLEIDDTTLNFESSFYLALNALNNGDMKELAIEYLNNASKKAYFKIDKDMVLFWKYLITNDETILQNLSESWDINIYSLYAMEKLNITPKNISFDVSINNKSENSILTQFDWIKIMDSTRNIDEEMLEYFQNTLSQHELPHLVFLKHRYHKHQKSFFITPYEQYLANQSLQRRTLIYAIARQESNFIPTSISTSFALGAMQIMPFLVNSLSKELGEDIYLEDMFDAQTNLKYANKHLDYLEPRLNHPLFISYAYNGGIGYTNRSILPLFKENLPYQPFMAMELISYDETKQYGKKVLANYIIYNNYLDKTKKLTISSLLEALH
ncbi:transglycosylase SLT domain-containing protein [Arcobacter sp. FWKO B]|uniref:transglycosylase SLT domain-containing protein n=1 Tax=Arcobacter sp. FWKO B TaxID=2593672 RepID=UPI0018A3F68F|nr:transglycosylase SLT domain-containing protein [Arcobacter sp. FWKO B]QOG11175.1 lytic transglycosylase domain-containing protein [Arcobacter sp. FWKO B]